MNIVVIIGMIISCLGFGIVFYNSFCEYNEPPIYLFGMGSRAWFYIGVDGALLAMVGYIYF